MDGLLVHLYVINVSIIVYFDFTYSGLHRCTVFLLSFVSLLHYLAIQPSRLQGSSNDISCQLSSLMRCCRMLTAGSQADAFYLPVTIYGTHKNLNECICADVRRKAVA